MFPRRDSIPMPSPRERIPTTAGWGIGLALCAALISGVAIFLNAFAVRQLPDPAVFTTLKNAIAAAVLAAVALAAGGRADFRAVDLRGRLGLVVIGIVGGSVPFVLFFTGLAQASAPSAAFIQKTLFVWVALLAVPLLGERLGRVQLTALAALFVGQAIVLPPKGIAWGGGETLIAAATLLWAVEVVLARRLLAAIPSTVLAASRMGIGLVVLVGYLALSGRLGSIAALGPGQWGWVLLTGLILAGYVATWFAALRRAPASVVTSVLVVGAVLTAALQAASKGTAPEPSVIGGYVLIAGATALIAALAVRERRAPGAATA